MKRTETIRISEECANSLKTTNVLLLPHTIAKLVNALPGETVIACKLRRDDNNNPILIVGLEDW